MTDTKEKRYIIDNPKLIAEWNWEKNNSLGLNPEKLALYSNKKVWWICSKGHSWEDSISHRSFGRNCPYCANRKVLIGYNDLQTVNPNLAKEWNYEKNDGLTPMDVMPNCGKHVWWKCSKGHAWLATVDHRNHGRGCPFCSGQRVLMGFNDLQTVNPALASEWNYEKNNGLTPMDVMPNSNKTVWWKCGKGHEWTAKIENRNHGNECPYCKGTKVLRGYNDLKTVNPTLANEWNYEKNGNLKPEHFTANSGKKVWWKCKKGHEWQARIVDRNKGNGCRVCDSEHKTSFPEYALVFYLEKYGLEVIHSYRENGYELDVYIPSKNVAIEYDGYLWHKNKAKQELKKNSRCKRDGIVLYRVREGLPSLNDSSLDFIVQKNQKDLPIILKKVLSEISGLSVDIDLARDAIAIENLREFTEKKNSFLVSNPEVASEWNYEKNGNLKPEHFMANSNKKVWWKCEKGHEWRAIINNRNKGSGCPYCASRKILRGYNDLQTVNPTLANEWNYEKNNGLTPADVMPNSNKKVWWKCSKGHEWQDTINHRNHGRGCSQCAKEKRKKV